ncbi:BQ2448_7397 [Microbotryum intermedium]|uniref:BQ2448_7397 protein n=1 Tax=Microbotryum intermedium TaxID=269621 RepID=A0A238FMT6_9BASI|nr:BQ2448_7397 [Microbotryum intermedium]
MASNNLLHPAIAPPPPHVLRRRLKRAFNECSNRALPGSAKWAAELLNAIPCSAVFSSSASSATATGAHHARKGVTTAKRGPATLSSTSTAPPNPMSSPELLSRFATSTPIRSNSPGRTAGTCNDNTTWASLGAHRATASASTSANPLASRPHAARDSLGSIMELASSPGGYPHHLDDRQHPPSHLGEEDSEMHPGAGRANMDGQELDLDLDPDPEDWDALESDRYDLALAYERTHEHLRASSVLNGCRGNRARWLRGYTKYLAGEKRAQEESGDLLGVKDRGTANPFAQELLAEMAEWEPRTVEHDPWLLYLKALLLLAIPPVSPSPFGPRDPTTMTVTLDHRLAAMDHLVQSVKLEPYNWSAWLKLASCLDGPEELEATLHFLPKETPFLFFFVHATLEIHAAGENLHEVLNDLDKIFPGASLIEGMRGLIHYHVREFDEATEYFTKLQESDPYRVEEIDIFSNILYVSEKRAELATLAQEYTKMDRSRPEVCCLVGNYYSLRREHEKAILYFRRALKLDRGYLSAWTLMGHEYVEIKNTNAAIASYRRAVGEFASGWENVSLCKESLTPLYCDGEQTDVNRKDYRAWYGLGQTYELLGEPYSAVNYYQKATALRPFDARMWCALAVCYEKLKRVPDAIKSYQRALVSSEPGENDTALRIGRLYALQGDSFKAASYHRRALAEGIKTEATKNELSKIRLWLAKYEIKRGLMKGDLDAAEELLKECLGVGEDKDEAELLLKELNVLLLSRE